MPWSKKHIKWLSDTGERIKISDGKEIELWKFSHQKDEGILTGWAKHFRNHYCLDTEIDDLRKGTGLSKSDYLYQLKFPDPKVAPGPSIRSGDFTEILVSDYMEYILNYWVPRTRYLDKTVRNESTKGSDIIGFKIHADGKVSIKDTLAIFEAKAKLTGSKPEPKMQEAVEHSAKDISRKAESLNAIKQRLRSRGELGSIDAIERFQNEVDNPYHELYGAVAIIENRIFDHKLEAETDTSNHPFKNQLKLILIQGEDMMSLVHELYQRAADEA